MIYNNFHFYKTHLLMFKGDLAVKNWNDNMSSFEVFFHNVKHIKRDYTIRENGKRVGFHMDKAGVVFKFVPITFYYYDGHDGLIFNVMGVDLHDYHIRIDCLNVYENTGELPQPIGLYYPKRLFQDHDLDNSKITDFML